MPAFLSGRVRFPRFLRFFLYLWAFLYFSCVCFGDYIRFRIKIAPGLLRRFLWVFRIGFLVSFSNIFFVVSELRRLYGRKGGNFDKGCCYNVPRGTLRYGRVSSDIRRLVSEEKIVFSASFITLHNVVIMANCWALGGGRAEGCGAARRNKHEPKDKLYEKPKPKPKSRYHR